MHAIFDDIIFVHFNTWCEKKGGERGREKKEEREGEGERGGEGEEEREIRNCYGSMIKYEMRTS